MSNFEVDLLPGEITVTPPKDGKPSQCLSCARYRGDRLVAGPCCQAYPGGIPTQIFTNEIKHDKHLPDDGGLYYVEDDDDLSVELALAYDESEHPRDDQGQWTDKVGSNVTTLVNRPKLPPADPSITWDSAEDHSGMEVDIPLVNFILGIQPDSYVTYNWGMTEDSGAADDIFGESTSDSDGTPILYVNIKNKKYNAQRSINWDEMTISNDHIRVNKNYAGQGLGTKILYDQVKGAKAAGFDSITADCVKMKDYNGYYTWARLGFDNGIGNVAFKKGWDKHWEAYGNNVSDIMKTQAGRDDWKKNGDGFFGVFDLNDKKALAVLTAARRAKDHDAIALSYNPALHPHAPAGSSKGGEFTSTGGGGGTATKEKPDNLERLVVEHVPSDQISTGPGFDRAFKSRQELQDYMDSWRPDLGATNTDYFAQALYPLNTGENWKPGVMQIYNTNVDFFQTMFPSFKILPPDAPSPNPLLREIDAENEGDDDEIYDDDEDPAVFDEETHGEIDGVKWSWESKEDVEDPDRILEQLEPADIIALVGAQKGASVEFSVVDIDSDAGEFEVQVSIMHPKYTADRLIKMGSYGETVIENESFFIKKEFQKQGLGAKVLYEQVKAAKAIGFTEIRTHSIRDSKATGYYAWPRLGYDAELTAFNIPASVGKHLSEEYGDRISDVMKTQEGRDYWREHGNGGDLVFDLKSKKALKVLTAAHQEHYPEALALSLCLSGTRLSLAFDESKHPRDSHGRFTNKNDWYGQTSEKFKQLLTDWYESRGVQVLTNKEVTKKSSSDVKLWNKTLDQAPILDGTVDVYRGFARLIPGSEDFKAWTEVDNIVKPGITLTGSLSKDVAVKFAKATTFHETPPHRRDRTTLIKFEKPINAIDVSAFAPNERSEVLLRSSNAYKIVKVEQDVNILGKQIDTYIVAREVDKHLVLATSVFVEAEHPRDAKGRFADKSTEIPYKYELDALWWGSKYREDSHEYDKENPVNELIDSWNTESTDIRAHELKVQDLLGKEEFDINYPLRGLQYAPLTQEMENVVNDWNDWLDTAPPWNGNGDLFRGLVLPKDKIDAWTTIDNVVTIHSSQSSSTKLSIAQAFAGGDTVLIIQNSKTAVPMWAALSRYHEYRTDNEFILRKGSKYRIVNVATKVPMYASIMERIITIEEIDRSAQKNLALSTAIFDESKHKRAPAGSSRGGEFVDASNFEEEFLEGEASINEPELFVDKISIISSPAFNKWANNLKDEGIEEGAISEWFAESSAIRKTELVLLGKPDAEGVSLPAFVPDQSWKDDVKEFHRLLDSAPPVKIKALYRGVHFSDKALEDFTKVGNVVTLHTTQSASIDSAVARRFGFDLLIVKNPTGAVPIYKLLEDGHELIEEKEAVLKRGKKYRITRVRKNVPTSGKINLRSEITLEELKDAPK